MGRHTTTEGWVRINGIEEGIVQRVLHADACLSDLDDTDAASPARMIALQNWKSRLWEDFDYFSWFLRTGWHYLFNGNAAASGRWKEYVKIFLRKKDHDHTLPLADSEQLLSDEQRQSSIFPGVEEFYSLLPAEKYYVSRNLPLVAQKYGQHLGFRDSFGEIEPKGRFAEHFVQNHPRYQHYLVRGNSEDDLEMKEVLESCVRRQKIKSVCGIYVAKSRWQGNRKFEIETSQDQRTLVEVLKTYTQKTE